MATSSKRSDYVYGELISPLERFSWTEDEVVRRDAVGARRRLVS
jgi:hypothetical protein